MPGGTGGPHRIQGVGFWAQQPFYNIAPYNPGPFIFRPPLKGLPEQPFPPNAFQSWTYSYNLNLIGQDRFPTGEAIYDRPVLAISPLAPTWTGAFPPRLVLPPPTNVIFRGVWKSLPDQPARPEFTFIETGNALFAAVTVALPPGLGPTNQDDWPNPQQPWRLDQTWTRSYNLSLIGKDAMLVGEQRYELTSSQVAPDQIQLRSWAWSYNLSLVGKDRLPTGEQIFELTIGQRPPEQIQLHSWQFNYNLNLIGKDQLVTGEQVYDLPPRDPRDVRAWSWQYNLNLIGQDRFPTGEATWERPTLPIAPAAPTWVWQYNPNLVGQDFLPFRQRDWPLPIAPQQPALSWTDPVKIWLTVPTLNITISQYWDRPQLPIPPARTWTWSYSLDLVGQDHMLTGEQIYDLVPSQKVPEQVQLHSWQWWYNLSLIGRDRLPIGEATYELAPPTKPYEQTQLHSWQWSYNLNLIGKDQLATGEQSTDLAPAQKPYRIDQGWTWSYNLNLISQDRMTVGAQSTDLPPRDFARLFQTWINTVSLSLVTAPPNLYAQARQQDWPVPRGAEPDWRRSWEWQYNKNLIGQDQLPFRQSDWPNPQAPLQAAQTWIDQTKILLAQPAGPLGSLANQFDWPLPQPQAAQVQTWINTTTALIAKPFAQTDWPNPTPFARDPTLSTIAASYNANLVGQDQLPNRQQDWPLSSAHALNQVPLQIMVQGKWFNLVPPPPLALPLNGSRLFDRPQLRPDVPADFYTITHAQQIPQPTPAVTPAVYNKPMLAGPAYLDIIPGEKPS
jgi:hypothetical protein